MADGASLRAYGRRRGGRWRGDATGMRRTIVPLRHGPRPRARPRPRPPAPGRARAGGGGVDPDHARAGAGGGLRHQPAAPAGAGQFAVGGRERAQGALRLAADGGGERERRIPEREPDHAGRADLLHARWHRDDRLEPRHPDRPGDRDAADLPGRQDAGERVRGREPGAGGARAADRDRGNGVRQRDLSLCRGDREPRACCGEREQRRSAAGAARNRPRTGSGLAS